MPQINRVKVYRENSYYHLYNRGNNKDLIFFSEGDYLVFRNILRMKLEEFGSALVLDCFCLMPNHYHLLIYQSEVREIERLMRSVITRYAMYINKKYGRVGRLFQNIYHGALVSPKDLAKVREYISKNPVNAGLQDWKNVGMGLEL